MNKCYLGKYCDDNHPKKNCTPWVQGNCTKGEKCRRKHDKLLKGSEQNQEQLMKKGKQSEKARKQTENNDKQQNYLIKHKPEQTMNETGAEKTAEQKDGKQYDQAQDQGKTCEQATRRAEEEKAKEKQHERPVKQGHKQTIKTAREGMKGTN